MGTIILIFITATLLWLIYWALIRTSLLDSIEDDYENIKTQVEWNIIEGLPESQSRSAQLLLSELEHYYAVRWISVGQAIHASIFKASEIRTAAIREKQIFEESPKWIRDFRKSDRRLTVKAALVNSPAWWIPLAAILLAGLFSTKVSNWWGDVGGAANKLRTCTPEVS